MSKFNNWFVCEVQNPSSTREWVPTNAQTMEGAKRAAKRAQTFQGTTIKVGLFVASKGEIVVHSINNGRGWAAPSN